MGLIGSPRTRVGEVENRLILIIKVTAVVVGRIGISGIDETKARCKPGVAATHSGFVQNDQSTTIGPTKGSVDIHKILAQIDFYVVSRCPLELHSDILGAETVEISAADIINDAATIAQAEVYAAGQFFIQGAIQHSIAFLGPVVANDGTERGIKILTGFIVENVDGTTDGVPSVHSTLWTP